MEYEARSHSGSLISGLLHGGVSLRLKRGGWGACMELMGEEVLRSGRYEVTLRAPLWGANAKARR